MRLNLILLLALTGCMHRHIMNGPTGSVVCEHRGGDFAAHRSCQEQMVRASYPARPMVSGAPVLVSAPNPYAGIAARDTHGYFVGLEQAAVAHATAATTAARQERDARYEVESELHRVLTALDASKRRIAALERSGVASAASLTAERERFRALESKYKSLGARTQQIDAELTELKGEQPEEN